MDIKEFEQAVEAWKKRVISAMADDGEGFIDTVAIMADIDKIVAKAFDRDPVIDY